MNLAYTIEESLSLEHMPNEILEKILIYTDYRQANLVCKNWNDIIYNIERLYGTYIIINERMVKKYIEKYPKKFAIFYIRKSDTWRKSSTYECYCMHFIFDSGDFYQSCNCPNFNYECGSKFKKLSRNYGIEYFVSKMQYLPGCLSKHVSTGVEIYLPDKKLIEYCLMKHHFIVDQQIPQFNIENFIKKSIANTQEIYINYIKSLMIDNYSKCSIVDYYQKGFEIEYPLYR